MLHKIPSNFIFMKHKLAVIVGVTMLFVALVVVNQSVGNNSFLKGDLGGMGHSDDMTHSFSTSDISTSACTNPRNCGEGYVGGTCDPTTCLQQYNTGMCVPGTTACAVATVWCEDPSLCEPAPSSSSGSGEPEFCSGSNGQCGGKCGTPGWECGWNDVAGSCVCDPPSPCGSCGVGYICDGVGECIPTPTTSSSSISNSTTFSPPPAPMSSSSSMNFGPPPAPQSSSFRSGF